MTEALTWIQAHRAELLEAAVALWVVASVYVRLTPSRRDDEALSRFRTQFLEVVSFLQPADADPDAGVFSLPGKPAKRPK